VKAIVNNCLSVIVVACISTVLGKSEVASSTRKTIVASPFSFSDDQADNRERDIPNVSVKITTSGRPVFVAIVPQSRPLSSDWEPYSISSIGGSKARPFSNWLITILRDSDFAVVASPGNLTMSSNDPGTLELPFSINAIDTPPPGTHTYTVRVSVNLGKVEIKGARLVAYEM